MFYYMHLIGVTVNLQSGVSAVIEGSEYVATITVEPTNLEAIVDVIVETYTCGGCNGANRKRPLCTYGIIICFAFSGRRLHTC